MIPRHLFEVVFDPELGRQMRFVAGPRQSGKTTLARDQLQKKGCGICYFNWDLRSVRSRYRENPLFYWESCAGLPPRSGKFWVCFDEIHKMPRWKNILKAAFDENEEKIQFMVTGSARLDWFRKSGDSLAGRYFLFHLLPVTLQELQGVKHPQRLPLQAKDLIEERLSTARVDNEAFDALMRFSGFPEPLTKQSEAFHRKWQEAYTDQLLREDLRDLTHIRELENVATLAQLLPSRIGSPLSINALREDLEVSHSALRNYLKALELTYVIFALPPYNRKIARSVKKEKKVYFYDWSRVKDPAVRFENFLAVQLQTWVTLWNDQGSGPFALYYVRTKDGKESDFLITRQNEPWLLAEAKLARVAVSPHHILHAKQLGDVPFVQLVAEKGIAEKHKAGWVISAARFLA